MNRVLIIGGGITGLSAAWALRQVPDPPEIVLLEQNDRLGGCIHTEHYDGFLMEHGPDVFLTRKPEAVQLCQSLGLSLQRTNDWNQGAYLRNGTRLYRIPEGMSGLVPGRIWPLISSPLLSLRGKLRVLAELVIPPGADKTDESVADFFTRRFGREAFASLIAPLLGGLAGGDPERLSLKALMPHMRRLESIYGSVLLGVDRVSAHSSDSSLQSLPDGLSSLTDALYEANRENIRLGHKVTQIMQEGTCWNAHIAGHSHLQASHIILSVPAWTAATITSLLNPDLAYLLRSILYRAGTTVHLAYNRADVSASLNGHGHLAASGEAGSVAACTWSACKLAGRAPAGKLLFRIYLRGADSSDTEVIEQARKELAQALHVTASPLVTRICRFPAALPQYTIGHVERIERIRKIANSYRGLFMSGNYLDGVGIPDCIRSGTMAADQIIRQQKKTAKEENG